MFKLITIALALLALVAQQAEAKSHNDLMRVGRVNHRMIKNICARKASKLASKPAAWNGFAKMCGWEKKVIPVKTQSAQNKFRSGRPTITKKSLVKFLQYMRQ